jgi:macrolide phosphotransferase
MTITVDPSWRSTPWRDERRTVEAVTSPADRGPLALAALASAAVSGLDPVSVEEVETGPDSRFAVAFVQDSEHRRWVIRSPRTAAASAQLEQSATLTHLLSRRLRQSVPVVKGWVPLPEGGRAAVYPYITGRPVTLEALEPGPGVTASLGRALAAVHNLDPALFDEAGSVSYDAETYRTRRLADLDRAAATGRVPTGLLQRWENQLEEVGWWRFSSVPTLGGLSGDQVLVGEEESGDLVVKGFLGWEDARVADAADDLAEIVAALGEEALDTFLEAYAHTRSERPDAHLVDRARLAHEMSLVRSMMASVAAGDLDGAEEHAASLRRLDEETSAADLAATPAAATTAAATQDDADDQNDAATTAATEDDVQEDADPRGASDEDDASAWADSDEDPQAEDGEPPAKG